MNLPKIHVWRDKIPRSPAAQMAVDEAIFRLKTGDEAENSAFLRFYTWEKPATTIGFFMPWKEIDVSRSNRVGLGNRPCSFETASRTNRVGSENRPCSFVRRLTGGGIVEHGDDVTFSISAGKNHPLSAESTVDRYRIIHEALRTAFSETGEWPEAVLAPISETAENSKDELACFSKPVGWDILESAESGTKIAGGAQRSSRGAWVHQGTARMPGKPSIFAEWTDIFVEKLGEPSNWSGESEIEIENTARDLEKTRYATEEWNTRI